MTSRGEYESKIKAIRDRIRRARVLESELSGATTLEIQSQESSSKDLPLDDYIKELETLVNNRQ